MQYYYRTYLLLNWGIFIHVRNRLIPRACKSSLVHDISGHMAFYSAYRFVKLLFNTFGQKLIHHPNRNHLIGIYWPVFTPGDASWATDLGNCFRLTPVYRHICLSLASKPIVILVTYSGLLSWRAMPKRIWHECSPAKRCYCNVLYWLGPSSPSCMDTC